MPDAPRRYHHGNLKQELVRAALGLFAERGSFDFTFRELARAVGVTHNAPYRHFGTREDLLAALRDEGLARLVAYERRALARVGDGARARVRALGEAYVRFALREPALFKLVLVTPAGGEARPPANASFALLEQALEEGRASGELRRDLAARELALVAWSLVHGLASLTSSGHLPRGAARLDRYAELLAKVYFDGAAAGVGTG